MWNFLFNFFFFKKYLQFYEILKIIEQNHRWYWLDGIGEMKIDTYATEHFTNIPAKISTFFTITELFILRKINEN